MALGMDQAAYFTNSDDLNQRMKNAHAEADESFWRLPITNEHR